MTTIRNRLIQAGLAAFCLLGSYATAAVAAPDPDGVWMRGDGNARVRIAPCGDKVCAVNLWIKDTSKGEHVGDRLVMSLKPKSANELAGTAYDPQRKWSYSITVDVSSQHLSTKGCIVGRLLCKSVDWTRVK